MFQAIQRVYGTQLIGLKYPEIVNGGLKWPPYLPDMNPSDYFLWATLRTNTTLKTLQQNN